MKNIEKKLINSQKRVRSNAKIYKDLAKEAQSKKMKKALKKLSKDDKRSAKLLKGMVGKKAKPARLVVRLKKELYKSLNPRDLYNLTVAKRLLTTKRFERWAEGNDRFTDRLATSVTRSRKHLAGMKKLV